MNAVAKDHHLLEGKVAIITGASRGIGAATARTFAQEGAKVVLAARSQQRLKSVADEINTTGGEATVVTTDVGEPESVQNLVRKSVDKYGRLDVAFNNAGDGHLPAQLADVTVEDFDRAIRTNVRGIFLCMKYEIPAMITCGGGAIVNMSSTAGLRGVRGIAGYAAGKHGIIGLTATAALDYAQRGIRVNAVAPDPILTERLQKLPEDQRSQVTMTVPMRRIGQPQEVAGAVAWLCSDYASLITGVVLPLDGGRLASLMAD